MCVKFWSDTLVKMSVMFSRSVVILRILLKITSAPKTPFNRQRIWLGIFENSQKTETILIPKVLESESQDFRKATPLHQIDSRKWIT